MEAGCWAGSRLRLDPCSPRLRHMCRHCPALRWFVDAAKRQQQALPDAHKEGGPEEGCVVGVAQQLADAPPHR